MTVNIGDVLYLVQRGYHPRLKPKLGYATVSHAHGHLFWFADYEGTYDRETLKNAAGHVNVVFRTEADYLQECARVEAWRQIRHIVTTNVDLHKPVSLTRLNLILEILKNG